MRSMMPGALPTLFTILRKETEMPVRIRITKIPPGSAPEIIRKQWVDVEMPAVHDTDNADWGDNSNIGGYVVVGNDAVDALLDAGRLTAAQFWGSPVPPPQLRFGADYCEVVGE